MDDDQAFPAAWGDPANGRDYYVPGMSLRDWFAGQALVGLLNPGYGCDFMSAPEAGSGSV